MAAGRPVIAFGQGGATETVLNDLTGEHFDVQCWEDIGDKVVRFNPNRYDPARIRAHAEQFSKQNFQQKMRDLIAKV
jgi:glycosyltransferase involved in cell wall biosynthesis